MSRPLQSFAALVVAGICLVPSIKAQAPPPGPVPGPPPAGVLNTPQQRDSAGITTLYVRSNLVVIDVVVSDSKQNPIHGLKASAFTLTEDNKPQTIRKFEEHVAMPASETSKLTPKPKIPPTPGVFTNETTVPANGPVNILLLDYLNTPLASQPYARRQLIEYLDKAPPGTRIAIFGLTSSLTMLQGFTSDPAVLKDALTKNKGVPQASDVMNNAVTGGSQTNTTLSDNFVSDALTADQQLANINRFQALQTAFEQQMRAEFTLHAFNLLSRYLVGIPGRKNLIWFSGAFPLSVEPQIGLQDAFDAVVRNDEELRRTDNLLTRAQIAVYPVDARGLFNDPANSAINESKIGLGSAGDASAQMDFLQQTAQEHETMFAMAEETGGHAFVNTNGLTQAVAKAIENGSNYYTLTYTPNNAQWDGRFRSIKVKVTQPSVKLSYRNGYYADDPNDKSRAIAQSSAMTAAPPSTMAAAMVRGGPDPTEILMRVRIRPAAEPPGDQPAQGNLVNPDPKLKVGGPYKAYGVDVVPDRRSINCRTTPTGNHLCLVEIATYVYDRDGQLIIKTSENTSVTLSPANYAKMQVTGMAFHQQVSVPVKGEYYFRTAIHDLVSDHVGAVEIPVASVAHLQPLDSLPVALPAAAIPGQPDASPALVAAPADTTSTPPAAPAQPADAPVPPAAATPARPAVRRVRPAVKPAQTVVPPK